MFSKIGGLAVWQLTRKSKKKCAFGRLWSLEAWIIKQSLGWVPVADHRDFYVL